MNYIQLSVNIWFECASQSFRRTFLIFFFHLKFKICSPCSMYETENRYTFYDGTKRAREGGRGELKRNTINTIRRRWSETCVTIRMAELYQSHSRTANGWNSSSSSVTAMYRFCHAIIICRLCHAIVSTRLSICKTTFRSSRWSNWFGYCAALSVCCLRYMLPFKNANEKKRVFFLSLLFLSSKKQFVKVFNKYIYIIIIVVVVCRIHVIAQNHWSITGHTYGLKRAEAARGDEKNKRKAFYVCVRESRARLLLCITYLLSREQEREWESWQNQRTIRCVYHTTSNHLVPLILSHLCISNMRWKDGRWTCE